MDNSADMCGIKTSKYTSCLCKKAENSI